MAEPPSGDGPEDEQPAKRAKLEPDAAQVLRPAQHHEVWDSWGQLEHAFALTRSSLCASAYRVPS